MHVRRLTVLATASAAAAALALAGCSSSSDDDATKPSASASATTAATPEAPAQSTELNAENFITTIADSMSGDASYHTVMTTSAGGSVAMTAEGDAVVDGDDIAMAMTMSSEGMEMEVRVLEGIWYMNLGELSGNKFFKVDPSDESNPMAASLGGLTDQMDPAASVKAMQDAVVSVEKSGEPETIDGVEAQPYEVVVDTSKITGSMGDALKAAGTSVPKTFTYTYWIGSDGKPRKMVMDQSGTTTEMTMTDWGKKVTVKAPPADQITDMPTS
ncbi:LppX_LprAFG lipoprotein [Cellulomonas edaphi]|uniref:LppX_LprAFG lipoprotein n=1 Tax=Cellulomonas edaphi TaxID=3053468 RepID=A0ABT7S2Y3_9CELL|nr:LppX_LprAFG lipoprotein [Cellulomons edaphi]MDM7829973.1 LppX_LprAFG lipoprotein [Cellulomons edaphi]